MVFENVSQFVRKFVEIDQSRKPMCVADLNILEVYEGDNFVPPGIPNIEVKRVLVCMDLPFNPNRVLYLHVDGAFQTTNEG